jgi:hypothetical protein
MAGRGHRVDSMASRPGGLATGTDASSRGIGPPRESPEDRADFVAEVVQVVESMVTALGQRLEEKEEKRLQLLLAEINGRLDDLARAAIRPEPKQEGRASRTTNTGA